jgi:peptidoglycan glycosyltransferase
MPCLKQKDKALKSNFLISPYFLVTHTFLLVGFMLFSLKYGPFEQPKPSVGIRSKGSQPTELPSQKSKYKAKSDLLISERRPGALNLQALHVKDGKYWGDMGNGWQALLTLDPALHQDAAKVFQQGRSAFGALVIVEIETGKIIGLSEYIDPDHPTTKYLQLQSDTHLALKAIAPGASLFKMVTVASLIEQGGVGENEKFCYQRMTGQNTKHIAKSLESEDKDQCQTLHDAFVEGFNDYFVNVSNQKLVMDDLKKTSVQLGFNRPFDYFELQHEPSSVYIPTSDIGRAQTAAGFKNSRINVLHAALMTAAVASNGKLLRPKLVENLIREDGYRVDPPQFTQPNYAFEPKTAQSLKKMLQDSGQNPMLSKLFSDWPSELKAFKVAGQVGVVTRLNPFIRYTWFNGFVPAHQPKYAIAVLVVNNETWYVRAMDVAHRVLKSYLSRKHVLTQLKNEETSP